jgi:predicted acetyltransferase
VTDRAASGEIREATAADRAALQRMLELYQHDLSDIWDQDVDTAGEYGYALDRYWASDECRAFVARADGCYAGFALVDREAKVGQNSWWMDQFFVLKKYRHRGIGDKLARTVFAALPGSWEVGQMSANRSAQQFWRRVISDYTGGSYAEHEVVGGWWTGVVQCFRSSTLCSDVPSPIDLRRMSDAMDWEAGALAKRPWRTEFFAEFAAAIEGLPAPARRVLELGSGRACRPLVTKGTQDVKSSDEAVSLVVRKKPGAQVGTWRVL